MDAKIPGIHHVTALAGDPQQNVDFYVGLLGLRLVKLTVNFDDTTTYHLYYGDGIGTPGTIMTFFPWPGARRGRRGAGQTTTTAFSVPADALDYWRDRLAGPGVYVEEPTTRFGDRVLTFYDPDGLRLEIVANREDTRNGWREGPVPHEYAIRGFHGVELSERSLERTATLLAERLGFRLVGQDGNRTRYEVGDGGPGSLVDVVEQPGEQLGIVAVGTVHHIAWRTPDDAQQVAWRESLDRAGYNVTPVMDRQYFHSIYFREPGGVLFEIATDQPGFDKDEPVEQLGTDLKLPPWLEPVRARIEEALPTLNVPGIGALPRVRMSDVEKIR